MPEGSHLSGSFAVECLGKELLCRGGRQRAVVLTVRARALLVCQPLEDLNCITRDEEERLAGLSGKSLFGPTS